MMHRLIALATVIIALASMAACQLPCDSQLRLLHPHLFTHCHQCTVSNWNEWEMDGRPISVPTSQCKSGKAVREVRRRRVISGDCSDTATEEYRTVCEPELIDHLILGLGLGSGNQDIDTNRPRYFNSQAQPAILQDMLSRRYRRSNCNTKQICHHVTTPGKRSAPEEKGSRNQTATASNIHEPEPLSENPIPFNIAEHGARYRRQQDCQPNGIQHVLFIIDSSGSVGKKNFDKVTEVLSNLIALFCRPIRVAVMTFDHEYFVEFCFNCYDNTCGGRVGARDAMAKIDYGRYGSTHTAGAARCVCDFMLTQTCGLPPTANCIDVVFITDGNSNDPNREICQDISCLHSRFGVRTYAIGIGNIRQTELKCISDADPRNRLFNFRNFNDFLHTFNMMVAILFKDNTPYKCFGTQGPGTKPCSLTTFQ